MKPLLLLLFLLYWAFPLSAQETVETTAGAVERRGLAGGASLLLQNLADRPVAAVTLVMPWGRAHDPQSCESLNKILSRCGGSYPAGTLLLRLEEMGGLSSYQTGETWSSFTLVVPRAYAGWATQLQLDRMAGQWLQGEDVSGLLGTYGAPSNLDATRVRSLLTQHFNPSQAVLSVVGGYDKAELQGILTRLRPAKAGQPGPAAGPGEFLAGRIGWSYPRPAQPRERAAAWLWRTALRSQEPELQLNLCASQDHYWLSAPVGGGLELARQKLQAAGPESGLLVTLPLRRQAVQDWLEEWDDLGSRSNLLAFQQAHGELGQDLKMLEALKNYDPLQWKGDMAWSAQHTESLPVQPAAPGKNPGSSAKARTSPPLPAAAPAAPPPFVRLEPTPGSTVLIQTVPDLPLVAVRAVLPGGSSCDAAALAGRAEWLAAYWQAQFDPEMATRVEAQPYGWQFSAYLPKEQATVWVSKWLQVWSNDKFDPLLAARCQPSLSSSVSPLQAGYREWLRLLFPPDHPFGREGERVALAPERLLELQTEIRQRGRWNLFLTGNLTSNDLTAALSAVPAAGEAWNHVEALATAQPPAAPVVRQADVPRASLFVGGYGPSRRDADYYAFVLLLQALAADPLRSRLQMELRLKQPLAERVDCSFLSSTGTAPWLLRIDCPTQHLAQVQARLKEQIEALRSKEISAEELRLAVSRLEGQQQVACKNSTGMVLQLRNLELFRLSDSYNQGFAGIYHNISAKDVLTSARLRLAPERIVTLVLTPKS